VRPSTYDRWHSRTRGSVTNKMSTTRKQQWLDDDETHDDNDTHDNDGTKFFRRIHVICMNSGIACVNCQPNVKLTGLTSSVVNADAQSRGDASLEDHFVGRVESRF
jgi:hypothetical protein